jgi:polyisoprenoid-binding protein YceI
MQKNEIGSICMDGAGEIVTDSMAAAATKLTHFVIDPKASRFTVQAFSTGVLSAMGHNPTVGIRKFAGSVGFNPDDLKGSGFRLSIQASSLSVQDDISDKDRREIEKLMSEQVLEVATHPEIVYEAAMVSITRIDEAVYSAALNGNLNFHGVTRNQPLTARIALYGEMLRASGEFTLRQSDYAIKPLAVMGGALKIKDELKFSFEMVARQQG